MPVLGLTLPPGGFQIPGKAPEQVFPFERPSPKQWEEDLASSRPRDWSAQGLLRHQE